MILDDIVRYKEIKITKEKQENPVSDIIKKLENIDLTRDFINSFNKNKKISIIAEVKKASPSNGVIRESFNHLNIAKDYEKNRVDAISVITEDKFFLGRDDYLTDIKKITTVPILRKDFIVDEYQIYQSKAIGADAILLIAAVLNKKRLYNFYKIARDIGIQCLVEVHDRKELEEVLEIDVQVIGINNRNLKTFKTQLSTTEELIKYIPNNKVIISESGINTRNDMAYLENMGVDGVLIGESFMRSDDIGKRISEFRGD